jgi:hypothetical protein
VPGSQSADGAAFAGTDVVVSNPAFGSFTDSQNRIGWAAGVGGDWGWEQPVVARY